MGSIENVLIGLIALGLAIMLGGLIYQRMRKQD